MLIYALLIKSSGLSIPTHHGFRPWLASHRVTRNVVPVVAMNFDPTNTTDVLDMLHAPVAEHSIRLCAKSAIVN